MSVTFGLTRNPALLEQYYQLREQCYRQELNLRDFSGAEESDDLKGHIFIASQNGRCLGGARIIAARDSLAAQKITSPITSPIGDLLLRAGTPCLWERLVISPEARNNQLHGQFCAHLINTSWALDFDAALLVSSRRNARLYRRCHSRWGVPFEIFRDLDVNPQGDFSALEHVLSVSYVRPIAALNTENRRGNEAGYPGQFLANALERGDLAGGRLMAA